jgi:hypothetical protein
MTMPPTARTSLAHDEPVLAVRVFRYALRPETLALAALVRAALDPAVEELRGEREIIFRTASGDPDAAMVRTVALVDRLAPGWRNLVAIDRLS